MLPFGERSICRPKNIDGCITVLPKTSRDAKMPERLLLAVPVIEKKGGKNAECVFTTLFSSGPAKSRCFHAAYLECDAANFAHFACAFINIKERSVPFDRPARYLKMLGHVG